MKIWSWMILWIRSPVRKSSTIYNKRYPMTPNSGLCFIRIIDSQKWYRHNTYYRSKYPKRNIKTTRKCNYKISSKSWERYCYGSNIWCNHCYGKLPKLWSEQLYKCLWYGTCFLYGIPKSNNWFIWISVICDWFCELNP